MVPAISAIGRNFRIKSKGRLGRSNGEASAYGPRSTFEN